MEVQILIPPAIEDGRKTDIRNWLNHQRQQGKSRQEIRAALLSLPTETPTKKEAEQQSDKLGDAILDELGIEVIGQYEDGRIEVYSHKTRKPFSITQIHRLSVQQLIQFAGRDIKKRVQAGANDLGGMLSIRTVQDSIAGAAADLPTLSPDAKRGAGCWSSGDSILLVGDGEISILNGSMVLSKSDQPRHGGQLYRLDGNPSWYRHDHVAASIREVDCREAVDDAVSLFGRWRWKFDTAPELVVGLILATWVQTLWSWRPQVVVTGEQDTGKSVLFRALKSVFCDLAGKTSRNVTDVGIVQWIGSSAKIVLIDELDRNKHREAIIEMVRSAGRGDDERWTGTGSQKCKVTSMSHLFWMAGIESGIKTTTDADRFVRLELLPRLPGAERISEPTELECREIGQSLLSVALRHANEAVRLAVELSRIDFANISSRVVETCGVPAAIYSLATGHTPEGVLRTFLGNQEMDGQNVDSDLDSLVSAILGAHVDAGRDLGRKSVEQLIRIVAKKYSRPGSYEDAEDALEKSGIVIVGERIRINQTDAIRHLLQKTIWSRRTISEILLRVENSESYRTKKKRFVELDLAIFSIEDGGMTANGGTDF